MQSITALVRRAAILLCCLLPLSALLAQSETDTTFNNRMNYVFGGQGTYSLGLYIPAGVTAGNYQVGVRVANACDAGGSYAVRNFYVSCNRFVQAYDLSPNPATNEVTITPTGNTSSATASSAKSSTTGITEVNIYDQQGVKVKQYKFANQKQVRLNVSGLKLGIYFVEIVAGSYRERQQLSIVK